MACSTASPHVVALAGPLTLSTAEASKSALLEGLHKGCGITVDCTAATEVDVTLVQLLVAAHRSAAEREQSFTLAHPVPPALEDVLQRCGMSIEAFGRDATFSTGDV